MRNPILAVLSNPPFVFLLISEFFSQFAMNLLNFILLIVVFSLSKSNIAVAGVVLSFTVPSILFGIIAGIYVDRWNRKNVLVYTNILRAFAVFPLIFLSKELFFVYLLSFLVSLVTQFFIPAETPIIPHLVKKHLLLSANALFSMGIFGSIIVAYALSGPLLLILGTTKVLVFITILFAVSSVFAALIRINKSKNKPKLEKVNILKEVGIAFSLMAREKKVYHSLFLLTLLQTLILVIAVIGPGYATSILHIQVEKFPLFFVTPAVIGMTIGAIVVGNYLHTTPKDTLAKVGLFIIGAAVVLFPHIESLARIVPSQLNINSIHIMIFISVIIGFAFSLVFVPSNTILQEETTDTERGKIYGSLNTLVGIVSIVPVLGVGVLADVFGVGHVITAVGMFIIGISILRFFKFK